MFSRDCSCSGGACRSVVQSFSSGPPTRSTATLVLGHWPEPWGDARRRLQKSDAISASGHCHGGNAQILRLFKHVLLLLKYARLCPSVSGGCLLLLSRKAELLAKPCLPARQGAPFPAVLDMPLWLDKGARGSATSKWRTCCWDATRCKHCQFGFLPGRFVGALVPAEGGRRRCCHPQPLASQAAVHLLSGKGFSALCSTLPGQLQELQSLTVQRPSAATVGPEDVHCCTESSPCPVSRLRFSASSTSRWLAVAAEPA